MKNSTGLMILWFEFFQLNENYKQYCDARRSENIELIEELENNNTFFVERYNDWGDIHTPYMDYPKWYKQQIKTIPNKNNDDFVIRVPQGLTDEDALNVARRAITNQYNVPPLSLKFPLLKTDMSEKQLIILMKQYRVAKNDLRKSYKSKGTLTDIEIVEQMQLEATPLMKPLDDNAKDPVVSQTRQIRRSRKLIENIIANTLLGRFPDSTSR
jgi:hypothetical protein